MNLAEEFKRMHEGWIEPAGTVAAVRARHAFAVFCHENAEAIGAGLRAWATRSFGPIVVTTEALTLNAEEISDAIVAAIKRRGGSIASDLMKFDIDIDAERIAFELWINSQSPLTGKIPRGENGYTATAVQSAWLGWCERAKGKTP